MIDRRTLLTGPLALALAGCGAAAPGRRPVPQSLIETAQIPGFPGVRIWADEFSRSFSDAILMKDRRSFKAAQAGRTPWAMDSADFLAISGGGDQGAFAAGVLKGWTDRGTRPHFDVVTGVSAGALGAPFAFLGPAYDPALRDIYTKLGAGDLFRSRGALGYFSDALEDTRALRETIEGHASDAFLDKIAAGYDDGRRILILSTNLDAERPVIWDLTAIAASHHPMRQDLFVKVLLASSAIPGIFPPVFFQVVTEDGHEYEEMHVDGGVTAQLVFVPPDMRPIEIEREVFGKVRKRALYVIRNGKIAPEYAITQARSVPIATRAVTTLVKNEVVADLERLHEFAKANDTAFYFCAVPASFEATAAQLFDVAYEGKLFEAGVAFGREGTWSTDPPISPKRFMR